MVCGATWSPAILFQLATSSPRDEMRGSGGENFTGDGRRVRGDWSWKGSAEDDVAECAAMIVYDFACDACWKEYASTIVTTSCRRQ